MAKNKMEQAESLLIWLASGEKDEDGNWLSDDDTQLVCDALEYYLNMHGQKDKMKQVAAMFGKKLFDTFHVKLGSDTIIARFSPYGFEWYDDHCMWTENGELLNKLLIEQAVIVD